MKITRISLLPDRWIIKIVLWKSSDGGNSWSIVSNNIIRTKQYLVSDNEVSFIYDCLDEYPRFSHGFAKVNSDDSLMIISNTDDKIRYIAYDFNDNEIINFTGLVQINTDTIVAVGKYKTISVSYDGGINWKLKSYFNASCLYKWPHELIFTGKDRMILMVDYTKPIYSTSNGGITWLPQEYIKTTTKGGSAGYSNYTFRNDGSGFCKYVAVETSDSNVIVTNNFAKTFSFYDNDPDYHTNDSIDYDLTFINTKGIDLSDKILFFAKHKNADNNVLFRYDKNYRFYDSIQINVKQIKNIAVTMDSTIILLGQQEYGENTPDSLGNVEDYSYKYLLLKSTDKGTRWDSLDVELPFYKSLAYTDRYTFYELVGSKHAFSEINYIHNDKIFYISGINNGPLLHDSTHQNTIYTFSPANNIIDSIKFKIDMTYYDNPIFYFGDRYYILSSANTFYYTDNIFTDEIQWDSLQAEQIFHQWDNLPPYESSPDLNTNILLRHWIPDDTTMYFSVGTYVGLELFSNKYRLNIFKMTCEAPPVKVEEITETDRAFLWNARPYPMPCSNDVFCDIYWNSKYNIDNAEIRICDIYGNFLDKPVRIEKMTSYSAKLSANFSDCSPGAYMILISENGDRRAVPVVVER